MPTKVSVFSSASPRLYCLAWASAALRVRPDILVLAHGGPISEPADADFILKHTKTCHGFYGASSMERLPTETAMTENMRRFKAIPVKQGDQQ